MPRKEHLYHLNLETIALRKARIGLSECNRVKAAKIKQADFANRIGPEEVAHLEPLHLDLHHLLSIL